MNVKKTIWARLACWMWVPPVAAFASFFLCVILYTVLPWPLIEALTWYYCYFSKYAAVWFGLVAAIISIVAAVVERRNGRKWIWYIACGVGHGMFGLLLKTWFELSMSV